MCSGQMRIRWFDMRACLRFCSSCLLGRAVVFASLLVLATSSEEELHLDRSEALKAKLSQIGAELSWPAFQNKLDLLDAAFATQNKLTSPLGALEKNVQVLSTNPYVLVLDNFLTDEECDFLKALGLDRLKPALVVQSADNWYDTQSQTRNNEQVWLTTNEERGTPMLRHVLKRMHRAARVPDEYAEALQIGRYKTSTKYEGHVDTDPAHKVARPTTMITYLNDPEEGGLTLFPGNRSDCGGGWKKHPVTGEEVYGAAVCCTTPELDEPNTVRVYAKKGRSVIFYSHHPDSSVNKWSLHIGCPVIKGEKWIAQRWFRFEPYNRVNYAKGEGWDARFDGVLDKQHSAHEEAHMRCVSQISPRVYLQEHFLSEPEVDGLEAFFQKGSSSGAMDLEVADLANDPLLSNLTGRVLKMARLPNMKKVDSLRLRIKSLSATSPEESSWPEDVPATTVSAYLSTLEVGGELVFPEARGKIGCRGKELTDCCAESDFKIQPHRGDAVLIYAHGQDGHVDETARHKRCPITRGETIVAEWQFVLTPSPFENDDPKPENHRPSIRFENQMDKTAWLFWVPPHGADETPMGEVAPGGFRTLDTFQGHVFHVRDESGDLIDKVTAGNVRNQRWFITAKKEL